MGSVASFFFVDPDGMSGGQLAWAALSYGYMLFWASNLISDGSELLLLIPAYAGLVGGIVLPVLGAVPDAMMVLFSGFGTLEEAQDKISVGVGALAGSTIMLLCIPWILSIWAGRVDIENGVCNYKKRPKLENSGLTNTGIESSTKNRVGAQIMLATSLCYLIIQIPAFLQDDQVMVSSENVVGELPNIRAEGEKENLFALVGSIVCLVGFGVYLFLQWKANQEGETTAKPQQESEGDSPPLMIKTNSSISRLPSPGRKMSCTAENILAMGQQHSLLLYLDDFRKTNNEKLRSGIDQGLIDSVEVDHHLMSVLNQLFKKYACAVGDERLLDPSEFAKLFDEMKLGYSREEVDEQFKKADLNSDKHVNFTEFVRCFVNLAATPPKPVAKSGRMSSAGTMFSSQPSIRTRGLSSCKEEKEKGDDEGDDDDDEESDEEDDDFKDLEPEERKRRILLKSFQQMGLGTLIVLSFSDPMVDVLAAMGKDMGISPFYVSFLLAPIASNASELTAAFNFASKKTKSSITISLDTLLGAACMNNTFCLGVFLALVYYQGLAWKFTAETITILVTEWIMFVYVMVKKTQTVLDGLFVLTLYPLSLALVYVLENFVGLD